MSRARTKIDQQFWKIVGDLRFMIDDGSRTLPKGDPEFSHTPAGASGRRRALITHAVAFLTGAFLTGIGLAAAALVLIF